MGDEFQRLFANDVITFRCKSYAKLTTILIRLTNFTSIIPRVFNVCLAFTTHIVCVCVGGGGRECEIRDFIKIKVLVALDCLW